MAIVDVELQDQHVGDYEPLTIDCVYESGPNRGDPIIPTAALALLYDPLRDDEISGTADAVGTKTEFVSVALAGLTDDFLNGMPCKVTQAADDGNFAKTNITDYASLTGTLTLDPLPWAVAEGDTLEVLGYPLITETDVTANIGGANGNEVILYTTASDAHSYTDKDGAPRGQRIAIFYLTYSATRKDTCRCTYNVLSR